MIITTKEVLDATLETRVYDCRDILAANTGKYRSYIAEITPTNPPKNDSSKMGPVSPGMGGPAREPPAGLSTKQSSGFGFGPVANENKGSGELPAAQATADHPHTPVNDLIDVMMTSIEPASWTVQGGPGTICEYDGLLIVNQTSEVQAKVVELLDRLSTTLASRAAQ
jgi:hypothetical protein